MHLKDSQVMKWYGILALLFLLCTLVGVVYLGMNTDNSFYGYDCTKNYNKYLKLFDYVDPTESIAAKSPERMAIYELEEELMDNGCI